MVTNLTSYHNLSKLVKFRRNCQGLTTSLTEFYYLYLFPIHPQKNLPWMLCIESHLKLQSG